MSDISKTSAEITQKPKQHIGTVVRVKINDGFGLIQFDGSDTLAHFRIKDVPKTDVDGVKKSVVKKGQRYEFDVEPNNVEKIPDNRRYMTHDGKIIEFKVVGKLVPTSRPAPVAANQSNPDNRMSGTVKWFNVTKGFGFITPDDGAKDVFVHAEHNGRKDLREGERVVFDRVLGARKAGEWSVSRIHSVDGKAVTLPTQETITAIPNNIPEDEIHTLKLEVREFQDGLRLVLPSPYTLLSIAFDQKADAAIFASYPEHRISTKEPLQADETLSMRVWVNKNGQVMLLPKDYKPTIQPARYQDAVVPEGVTAVRGNRTFITQRRPSRPNRARTPGRSSKPQGNNGQK